MGIIPRALRSLGGFHGKQGLLGTGVDVGAASRGDGRTWTRVGPRVQRGECKVFARWSQGDLWQDRLSEVKARSGGRKALVLGE